MEVYNKVENDINNASDVYLHDVIAGHEYDELDHNMQMIRYIEEEEITDRSNLIDIGVLKPTTGNVIKRVRI